MTAMTGSTGSRYYVPSGGAPVPGIVMMLGGGLVCGVVLGAAYAVITLIPLVGFINIACIFGLGWAQGLVLTRLGFMGKIRSMPVAIGAGIVGGLFAWYFSWVGYLCFNAEFSLDWALPWNVYGAMQFISENPMWSVKGATPEGMALWILWVIEAGGIIGVTTFFVVTDLLSRPFCEACDCFTDVTPDAARLEVIDEVDMLQQALEGEQYEVLDLLDGVPSGWTPSQSCQYLQIETSSCPSCTQSDYLTIQHVTWDTNGEGKLEESTSDIVKNLHVTRSVMDQVCDIEARGEKAVQELAEQEEAEAADENGCDAEEGTVEGG